MIYIVLGLIGAVLGAIYLYGGGGTVFGALLGILSAAVINQRHRIQIMDQRLKVLEAASESDPVWPSTPAEQTSVHENRQSSDDGRDLPFSPPSDSAKAADIPSLELELAEPLIGGASANRPEAPQIPDRRRSKPDPLHDFVRRWVIGENIMVRIGVVLLLFGVAFLVKYAAARDLMPLEIRLGAAFVAGIGLLVVGWRLRVRRFAYAVTLQGGGIGVMYLTLFAAARLFHLVPLPFVFALMIGLVIFSGALAVLQNAAAMAVIGAAGGFMAPVLLSTGTGSHVMLFSYYALLNVGIFGIAWFKTWRWLNLLGFTFTFGIGSIWGVQFYRPSYFASTEPFLVLFFLFYLSIAVLFALRQPPHLKGYVDGTLVFGLPLAVFSLQVGVVDAIPYGLAFSAVTMGLIYAALATVLWRQCEKGLRTLVEAFLALGVIFGSLAVPLALSGHWTAVTWSLEGAGLVWVGLRQRRWMARAFGLLLQIGSGAVFLIQSHNGAHQTVFFNGGFLGGMMVGMAGLFCAFMLERHQQRLHALERPLSLSTLAWGLAWWFATGAGEIHDALGPPHAWMATMSYIGASAMFMGIGHRRLNWQGMRFPALGLLPVMVMCWLLIGGQTDMHHPFQGWWIVIWPVLFAVHRYLLYEMDRVWRYPLSVAWHTAGALLATVLVSWETSWWMDWVAGGARVWRFIAWGGVPALILLGVTRFGGRLKWPSNAWNIAHQKWLPLSLAVGLGAWSLMSLSLSGNPRPLPYLPLFNPLDLSQAFIFLAVINLILAAGRKTISLPMGISSTGVWTATALCIFLWLTAGLARAVHAYAFVPYEWESMLRSDLFHAAVSVLWGLVALGCMVAANRRPLRGLWFSGAGLLGIVVVKLFVVDLAGSGTISRIVSFLAVGLLMLVIGFFTPLPPATSNGVRS